MSNPYLIISSDCHAGPETPDYREFLDPQYREPFDESLEERARLIAENKLASPISMGGDEDFQEEWFGHDEGEESLHEGGLRCGWDAPKRDKELDNDGVTAEVIFPGPDAATGSMGAPFGAGLVLHAEVPPDLMLAGAKAYNRWLAELCQHTPGAPQGSRHRADPRQRRRRGRGDPPLARVGPHRWRDDPRDVGRLPVVRARHLRPRVGGVRRAPHAGAHALRPRRAPRLRRGCGRVRPLRERDALVDGAPDVVPAVLGRRSRSTPA